jgi:integrase
MREVGGMTWAELAEKPKWILPASRTKNKRDHKLILPPAAWAIIAKVAQRDKPHLFGRSEYGFTAYSDGKALLDQRLLDQGLAPWTIHDIRRTVATKLAESPNKEDPKKSGLGVKPHVVEALLNHISGHKAGVAGIYNRASYLPEVKIALARWAEYVASIVSGEERKIIQFPAESGAAS